MVKRLLIPGPRPTASAEMGFTLVEAIIAMMISVSVLMAGMFAFNTTQKNLAYSRALTNATNLATAKIAEFKTRLILARPCRDAVTGGFNDDLIDPLFTGNNSPCGADGSINVDYPGIINEPFCSPASSSNPAFPLSGASTEPLCLSPGVRNPNFVKSEAVGASALESGVALAVTGGLLVGEPQYDEPLVVDGTTFTRSWTISFVDTDADGRVSMTTDVVRINLSVAWTQNGKTRTVTMSTFTNGRPIY